ncbi:MAG: glycosyltransferase family 2 protein, partial [Clostridia bacterium]|nr:glycosyltransferase family 2 protein [Clostridia bacterium]
MKNPAVSIIVPVYKVEKYINRCIDSILAQTFNDFELILVDDGSPDNSGAICDECAKKDSRIKVIHKQNGGVSSARNAGIKVAQGEFINFIDSDDTIPVDSLENLINLQKQNDADFVCCGFDMYSENSFIKTFPFVNKYIDFSKIKDDDARVFLSNLFRGPCAKLYKNNIVQKNNMLFDENVHIGEDTIFVYDYLSRCKNVRCGDIVVYNYLRNDQSA